MVVQGQRRMVGVESRDRITKAGLCLSALRAVQAADVQSLGYESFIRNMVEIIVSRHMMIKRPFYFNAISIRWCQQ